MATLNWRTINIDALDPESAANFDTGALSAPAPAVSAAEAQALAGQVRQLLRGGDAEGALRGALEMAPYGGDGAAKELHLATVVEVLQSIKQADMSPILTRIYEAGGADVLDVLMKYIYKGMAASGPSAGAKTQTPQSTGFSQVQPRLGGGDGAGQAMSVLLSWHEKVVDIAGLGSVIRVMSDRRTV